MKLVELTVAGTVLPFVEDLLEEQGVRWQVSPFSGGQRLHIWCGLADAIELEEYVWERRKQPPHTLLGHTSRCLRVQIGRIKSALKTGVEYKPARGMNVSRSTKQRGMSSDQLRGRSAGVDAKVKRRAKATPRTVVQT